MRSRTPILLGAVLGAASFLAAGGALAADPPVTLRFGVADGESRPSDPYVRAFAEEVSVRSGGTVTIEITWEAGDGAPQGFERGVAHLVTEGALDLGMAAGRAWDDVGLTALQALQAPFLIDSDPLAEAVATSPVATQLLDAMSSVGVTGLAMWPEDLRHPVTFENCIAPIVTPEQFQGATVRAIPSVVTIELLQALGATHAWVDGYEQLVESCEIQAAESGLRQGASLPGRPTFTGDVTFFPKVQVLAANAASFGHLTEAQQQAVREAAVAVRDIAIAEHPTDADAAAAWCADGGRVVLAGPDAIQAFQQASRPVIDRLEQDRVVAAAIAAIRDLKAATPASQGAMACDASAPASPTPEDLSGFVGTTLPNGTFRAVLTEADLLQKGASSSFAASNWGTKTWTFDDGKVTLDQGEHGGPPCWGRYDSPDGTGVEMVTEGGGCGIDGVLVWRPVPGGILLAMPSAPGVSARDLADNSAFNQRVWMQIDGPPVAVPSGSPAASPTAAPTLIVRSSEGFVGTPIPDGTYRAEITTDSLRDGGASENFALRNTGVFTLSIHGATMGWSVGRGDACTGTISSNGTVVSIREDVPDTCMGGRFLWREAPAGVELQWVAVDGWPATDNNDLAAYFDRVWLRID